MAFVRFTPIPRPPGVHAHSYTATVGSAPPKKRILLTATEMMRLKMGIRGWLPPQGTVRVVPGKAT